MDVKLGDRVSLFMLARDTTSHPFDKIGRVVSIDHRNQKCNVTLEKKYDNLERRQAHRYQIYSMDGDVIIVLGVPFDELDVIEQPDIFLTPSQLIACLIGPWSMGYGLETRGVALHQVKKALGEWVTIENAEDVGEDGSGVLMSENGVVHYSGPAAEDTKPTRIVLHGIRPDSTEAEEMSGFAGLPYDEPLAEGDVLIVVATNNEVDG